MKAFLPLEITSSVLTSSSVPEIAPAAYAGGTTYALNATASIAGLAGLFTVYRSLQAGNTGNAPASSPLWWIAIGDTYGQYSGGATYALADRVIDSTNHLVYESRIASNTGQALADVDKWLLVGPTNQWAMFNYTRSNKTSVPSDFTVVLTPGQRINSIAFDGLMADSVTLTGTSVVGGGAVYGPVEVVTKSRDVFGWWDWLFRPFRYRRGVARYDLPALRDLVLTITVAGTDIVCGKIGIGTYVFLGTSEAGAEVDRINTSRVTRDDFAELSITPRRQIPTNKHTLHSDPDRIDSIREFANDVSESDVTAFWSGADVDTHDYADALSILGLARVFRSRLLTGEVVTTLELEAL